MHRNARGAVVIKSSPERTNAPQIAACPKCGAALDFPTDGMGNVVERCSECERRAQRGRAVRAVATDPAPPPPPALPPIEPGQLRCQDCAHGVVGKARFCKTCARRHIADGLRRRWREIYPDGAPHRSPKRLEPTERLCAMVDCDTRFMSKIGRFCPRCVIRRRVEGIRKYWAAHPGKHTAPKAEKVCARCATKFLPHGGGQKYCPRCRQERELLLAQLKAPVVSASEAAD